MNVKDCEEFISTRLQLVSSLLHLGIPFQVHPKSADILLLPSWQEKLHIIQYDIAPIKIVAHRDDIQPDLYCWLFDRPSQAFQLYYKGEYLGVVRLNMGWFSDIHYPTSKVTVIDFRKRSLSQFTDSYGKVKKAS